MCYQAIITKYIGPTNFHGSRVKAATLAGSLTIEWDDSKNSEANHIAAAKALAEKLGWDGEWYSGCLPSGDICFVLSDGPSFVTCNKREAA